MRAIVKALLRSIRALKDAVLLTVFCVSVFGLVGYQLFHGTMRQKCIRIAGTLDIPPDSLFLNVSAFANFSNLNKIAQCETAAASGDFLLLNLAFAPVGKSCTLKKKKNCSVKRQWSYAEKSILNATINYTKKLFQPHANNSDPALYRTRNQCAREGSLNTTTNLSRQYMTNFFNIGPTERLGFDPGDSESKLTHFQADVSNWNFSTEVKISVLAADVDCLQRIGNNSNDVWMELLNFGDQHLDRWNGARQYIIRFQVRVLRYNGSYLSYPFLYYSEMDEKDLPERNLTEWMEDEENQCKVEPKTVVFFHPGSPDRPVPEPIYCSMSGRFVQRVVFLCCRFFRHQRYCNWVVFFALLYETIRLCRRLPAEVLHQYCPGLVIQFNQLRRLHRSSSCVSSSEKLMNFTHLHNSCIRNRDHHILLIMTGNAHKESCDKLLSLVLVRDRDYT